MGKTKPSHVGPLVLPNFPLFLRLAGHASNSNTTAIDDRTNDIQANHLQLLTDCLHVRNTLLASLSEEVQEQLWQGEEVYFILLAPGSYEYAVAFLAILAVGGIVVPICMQNHFLWFRVFPSDNSISACIARKGSIVLYRQMQLEHYAHCQKLYGKGQSDRESDHCGGGWLEFKLYIVGYFTIRSEATTIRRKHRNLERSHPRLSWYRARDLHLGDN